MSDRGGRPDVRRTYNRIAEHFATTRSSPWPEVEEFVHTANRADRAIDLGCGNGRHLPLLAETARTVIGVDSSRTLLQIAKHDHGTDHTSLIQGDVVAIPLRESSIDLGIYIATMHHLPSRELRVLSLDEIDRVLRPGARCLVSAWSVTHDRFDASEGHDTVVPWTLPSGERVDRFYHIYDMAEFIAEIERSTICLERSFESRGNCYAIVSAVE